MMPTPSADRPSARPILSGARRRRERCDPLLSSIESYLRRTRMPPSRFGRLAVRDPRLVFDLENGRVPGDAVRARAAA